MMPFPDSYANELGQLPAEQMGEDGRAAIESLKTKGYEVRVGLTPEFADAIAAMALEPSIKEYCPNDSGSRFINRQTTAQWLSNKRATFLLLHKADNGELELAGYGWVGAKQSPLVPGGENTFSLRVGENHQGRGLAAPFSVSMLYGATAIYGARHIWLETWESNGGAVHIYHKIGFNDVAAKQEERSSTNGQMVPDTRLFMSRDEDVNSTPKTDI
ncbi:MAG TPA: hypothetical protein VNG32_02130 [Candidatus Dormibacteraeota bacterium]|nr:hypothetical protein [Candidatus Dormibacteraeota bacterium]